MFFIEDKPGAKRYDPTKFMPVKSVDHEVKNEHLVLYDEYLSYFIQELRKLPRAGEYTIKTPYRPDIYAYAALGSMEHWQLLLYYNSVVDINTLTIGAVLYFPSVADIENLYFTLKARQHD